MNTSMKTTLIKNAQIVNEGEVFQGDLRIEGDRISAIASELPATESDEVIDAQGKFLLPGIPLCHRLFSLQFG